MTDNYDGSAPTVSSLTGVTPGGSPVTVNFEGIENLKIPERSYNKDTYPVISGTYAGKERVLATINKAGDASATVTYEVGRTATMDALVGINGTTFTWVLSDGLTLEGTGFLEKVGMEQIDGNKHATTSIAIALDAGWTLTEES
jgi:hypothetical protein